MLLSSLPKEVRETINSNKSLVLRLSFDAKVKLSSRPETPVRWMAAYAGSVRDVPSPHGQYEFVGPLPAAVGYFPVLKRPLTDPDKVWLVVSSP